MPLWFGISLLIAVAVLLACLGVLAARLRSNVGSRLHGIGQVESGGGRLSVLESAPVDAQRRLLLVRCDEVDHLIMIGGPSDLVVEHDVRRRQPSERSNARPLAVETSARSLAPAFLAKQSDDDVAEPVLADRIPPETGPFDARTPRAAAREAAPRAIAPRAPAMPAAAQIAPTPPTNAAPRVAGEQPGSLAPAPIPRAIQRSPSSPAAPIVRPVIPNNPGRAETAGDNSAAARPRENAYPRPRQQNGTAPPNRGEGPVAQAPGRAPNAAAAPAILARQQARRLANQASDAAANGGRSPRPDQKRDAAPQGTGAPTVLPVAEIPWPEPERIEEEIVRALRVDPQPPLPPTAAVEQRRPEPTVAPPTTDPATTLGDLAERLEQALAHEVGGKLPARQGGFSPEQFSGGPSSRMSGSALSAARPQANNLGEPGKTMSPSPEPDSRPEHPRVDRQEEAPVIALSTRRREPIDPLEDEMARLLGELTGDTTRR